MGLLVFGASGRKTAFLCDIYVNSKSCIHKSRSSKLCFTSSYVRSEFRKFLFVSTASESLRFCKLVPCHCADMRSCTRVGQMSLYCTVICCQSSACGFPDRANSPVLSCILFLQQGLELILLSIIQARITAERRILGDSRRHVRLQGTNTMSTYPRNLFEMCSRISIHSR